MHCYEKDFPLLTNFAKAIAEKQSVDICYNYLDDWDELMNGEIPGINKLVEELKAK
jgi:hypothetical protein